MFISLFFYKNMNKITSRVLATLLFVAGCFGIASANTGDQAQIIIDPVTKKIYVTTGFFQNTGFDEVSSSEPDVTISAPKTTTGANTGESTEGLVPSAEEVIEEYVSEGELSEFDLALVWMYSKWLTMYDNKSDYRSDDALTREESTKMFRQLYEALGYEQTVKSTSCDFADKETIDPSLSGHVKKVCERGMFHGSQWYFYPHQQLTRPQAMAVLLRMFEWKKSNEDLTLWWEEYYQKWKTVGIIDTTADITTYNRSVTRREMAIYAYRLKNIASNEQLKIMSLNVMKQISDPQADNTSIEETVENNLSALAGNIDANDDPELNAAIGWMHDNGLTMFESVDTYMPFNTLTRSAAAKMLDKFSEHFDLSTATNNFLPSECQFSDIDQASEDLKPYIQSVCKKWILKWSQGKFMPNDAILKSHFIVALIRMLKNQHLDETTNPWRKNYYEEALSLDIVGPADALTFENQTTRYEAAIFLYRFKVKYQMINSLNTTRLQNEVLSTVPGSISTGVSGQEANVYIDLNLIRDGNFEIGYVEIFGTRYKVVKTAMQKYITEDNFVRYGDVFELEDDTKVGTLSFIISSLLLIEGNIRLETPSQNYMIQTVPETSSYYKLKELK